MLKWLGSSKTVAENAQLQETLCDNLCCVSCDVKSLIIFDHL